MAGPAGAPALAATFAGVPLANWAFGLRNWAAMMLALFVAFWLQLEGAQSAATCVGILALPTRGQVIDKAVNRVAATVIGVAMSIALAGAFNGMRDLFLVAVAAWLGLCVFVASLTDGARAYGAVLSGYTVAIVAVAEIDNPHEVFSAGINRGAAIIVGIAAIALVNDTFVAPNVAPGMLRRLRKAQAGLRDFALRSLAAGDVDAKEAGSLLKAITAAHADIAALLGESPAGRVRSAAAATAILAMVREVTAVRLLAKGADPGVGQRIGETVRDLLSENDGDALRQEARRLEEPPSPGEGNAAVLAATTSAAELLRRHIEAEDALQSLESGRGSPRRPRLRVYRSRHGAALNGLRAFLTVLIAAAGFVLAGWPSLSFSLVLVCVVVALASNNPKPAAFATIAVIALPIVAAVAGITQFVILDGADEFELLALAMAPTIVGGSLLILSGTPALGGIGFLFLVVFPILLAPANPQSYNPEQFLVTALLAIIAALADFVFLSVLFPLSDAKRRHWILASAKADLRRAAGGPGRSRQPDADDFRAADRAAQLASLPDASERDIERLLRTDDLAAALRRLRRLDRTQGGVGTLVREVQVAGLGEAELGRAAHHVLEEASRVLEGAGSAGAARPASGAASELAVIASLLRPGRADTRIAPHGGAAG